MSAACQMLTVMGDSEEASGKWCSLVYLMGYHQLLHGYMWRQLRIKSGHCAIDTTVMNTVIPSP